MNRVRLKSGHVFEAESCASYGSGVSGTRPIGRSSELTVAEFMLSLRVAVETLRPGGRVAVDTFVHRDTTANRTHSVEMRGDGTARMVLRGGEGRQPETIDEWLLGVEEELLTVGTPAEQSRTLLRPLEQAVADLRARVATLEGQLAAVGAGA